MGTIKSFFRVLVDKIQWLPAFLSRLTIAGIFIPTGWGKLHNLNKVIEFFTSLGIPAPRIQAPMVASIEFIGGILILLGLFTRAAAIPLMGTMVVAIATAKIQDISDLSDFLSLSEYLFFMLLLWLAIKGAGALSIDHLLCKKSKNSEPHE